jgi:hypothetical protein
MAENKFPESEKTDKEIKSLTVLPDKPNDVFSNLNNFFSELFKKKIVDINSKKEKVGVIGKSFKRDSISDRKKYMSNPSILEVDLIKDQVDIRFNWNKNLSILGIFSLITLVLVAEVYITLFLWQKNEIATKTSRLKQESRIVNEEINKAREDATEALEFKSKSEAVSYSFYKHVYWSNFFNYLEKNTLADVYYSGFGGDTTGIYILKSFVQDFRALAVQLRAFISDPNTVSALVANEKINNTPGKTVGVLFDLNLIVSKALFNK